MSKLTLILAFCCVVLLALWLRSCRAKAPDNSAQDRKVDSINAILKVHDSASQHKIDSVAKVSVILSQTRDSLVNLLTVIKGSLKGKDKDIQGLLDAINAAEVAKDTQSIVSACDSLKRAYPIAKGLVTEYISRNDSLIAVNAQIVTAKDTIIGRLNSMFTETNNSLFQISREYGLLSENYKKEVKKAAKRFGIGPSITAGIVGGKFEVVPGISVTYSLIRF